MTETDAKTPAAPASAPRRWDWRPKARWFAAEYFIVVLGVLTAVGLNAAWEGMGEAREGRRLQELIRDDVVAMRSEVTLRRDNGTRLLANARELLGELASPSSDAQPTAALSKLGSIFVMNGLNPVNHTYVEAMSSGRLRLIEDETLRLSLTRYQAQIEQIRNDAELIETQYYTSLEPFLVANTIYSEIAAEWWRDSLVEAPFGTDYEALADNRELWNLLTLRLEAEVTFQTRLDRLDEMADALLLALPEG